MDGKDREMEVNLAEELRKAAWVANNLFERGMVTGSTGNISICREGKIYVSPSGGCFGRLCPEDFCVLDMQGKQLAGSLKPSKEWPLHMQVYEAFPQLHSVLHTHSRYSVLWSCLEHESENDCIPDYTPYLRMRLGRVGLIPYEKPGSQELFRAFGERIRQSDGWLLKRHGAVVPGKNVLEAFYALEELEEAAHIAWELRKEGIRP